MGQNNLFERYATHLDHGAQSSWNIFTGMGSLIYLVFAMRFEVVQPCLYVHIIPALLFKVQLARTFLHTEVKRQ